MSIDLLREGTVIPAHPLALTSGRTLDERRQRALTRYYLDAGAGGVAVGVHTTQFAIREAGLLQPVLEIAAEVAAKEAGRPFVLVAGACGDTAQAVAEAELAASLGYHAVLLSPQVPGAGEEELLERAKAVGEVLPVIGFYLQEAVGGRRLSPSFWRSLSEQESLVAIKMAPFDRYRTVDVARAVGESGRGDAVALYTGNDDNILDDLLTPVAGRRVVGGLLGQWAVWTRTAVLMLEEVRRAWAGDDDALRSLLARSSDLTDANAAVFDVAGGFRGCVAGIHEVLRGQGLLEGIWCLDPDEGLSPGQAEEIARVRAAYPWLMDDDFVAARLDDWLR
ncbi:dihydrodipicolinate synthase family protein [Nonomuraea pusilla]|uniref:Dihydrodipicolinate synthase/N-acetylneuraminate lyase n=1 Tax=Nonomuraea pusilla TaxID=46177 RepID=A0A1H7TPV7_9ACTN|nr:dihydrodipicolinate synthase family protein [Nonomuraea pusilla]SEL86708.1 Dihydrodipicolinate synthase/N-acetylneuraminate lyase [Nonomuraea pusilla]